MMPDVSAPKVDTYPEAEAGSEYFASAAHYQSVAGRILAALTGGGRFVLATGNPPPNGRLLASALAKAAAGTHSVIGIPCGQGVTRDDWRRLVLTSAGEIEAQEFSAGALLVALGSPLPLYVLEDADQLSDEQLREFCATWLFGEPTIGVAVLAVNPAFLTRLERPSLSFLIEGLAARVLFQHLGPDEIGMFLREQTRDEPAKNFTPDAIAAIAAASGGDPTLVNRLAFRSREQRKVSTAPLTPSMAARAAEATSTAEPEPAAATGDDVAPEPALPSAILPQAADSDQAADEKPARRPGIMRRRLVIGGIFVVGYVGVLLVLGTLIPKHFRIADKPAETEAPLTATAPPAPAPVPPPAVSSTVGAPPASPATGASLSTEAPATAPPTSVIEAKAPAATEAAPSAAAPPPRSERSTPLAVLPNLPADEISALIARGDQFLNSGDIISARLYYERAANAGDGRAALLMAETFDPAFLDRAGVRGVRGDASVAAVWYARARDLGEHDAERGLEQLNQQK